MCYTGTKGRRKAGASGGTAAVSAYHWRPTQRVSRFPNRGHHRSAKVPPKAARAMATAGASRSHSLRKCRHMRVRGARASDWGATTAAGATAVPRRIDHRHECLSRPCLAFRSARDAHRNPGTLSAAPVIRSCGPWPGAACVPRAGVALAIKCLGEESPLRNRMHNEQNPN